MKTAYALVISLSFLTAFATFAAQLQEAAAALKQLPPDVGTSDGIRQALKLLSRV